MLSSTLATSLILSLQSPQELPQGVTDLLGVLAKSGRPASTSEKDLLIGLNRLSVQSELTAQSLSECLSVLTKPGDAAAADKLLKARNAMAPLFELAVNRDSEASEVRRALSVYAKDRLALQELAKKSTDLASTERFKLTQRPGSGLSQSVSVRLVRISAKTDGINVSAHGLPLTPGVLVRFAKQRTVSLIASPWDPRTIRRSEFKATNNIEILPSTYSSGNRTLEYASKDRTLVSKWEMTGESYKWSGHASPAGTAQISQGDFQPDEGYKVLGHFGFVSPMAPSSTVTITLTGKVDWLISSTRNGKKVSTPESHAVKQTLQLEVFCL